MKRFGGFARKVKRYSKTRRIFGNKGSKSGGDLLQFDAMAYGAVRPAIASTVGNFLPFQHELKDEVVMGLVDWGTSKYVGGFLGQMARKGLVVENARVGEYFGAPIVNSVFGQVMGSTSSTGIYAGGV